MGRKARNLGLRLLAAAVALALIGCADDTSPAAGDDDQAEGPTDEPAANADDRDDAPDADVLADVDGLLDGVPDTCSLLADTDPELDATIVATIDTTVAHGPLVVVEVDGEGVVATTTYLSPGVEGPAAVWHLEDGEPVAISDEAARISTADVQLRDSAGTDAIARARAEAADCSWIAADRSAEDPPPPEPRIDDSLMVAEPNAAHPGDLVAQHFPENTVRGVAFELQRRDGDAWSTTHLMVSDADNSSDPVTVPADTEGFGWPDIGITGPGPDHVRLPDELEPGEYRICTESREPICAHLHVLQ